MLKDGMASLTGLGKDVTSKLELCKRLLSVEKAELAFSAHKATIEKFCDAVPAKLVDTKSKVLYVHVKDRRLLCMIFIVSMFHNFTFRDSPSCQL